MYCASNYVVKETPIGNTDTLQFRILINNSCLFSAYGRDVTDTLSSLDIFQLRKRDKTKNEMTKEISVLRRIRNMA